MKQKYNKKYLKEIGYYDNPNNKILVRYLLKFKSTGKLLELGCAEGHFLKYAEKYFETYGIDISQYAISKAKINATNSKIKVVDVEKDFTKFVGKKKFDIIIALDILEHLRNPSRTLSLICKTLNKDGIFVFRVPNLSCINLKLLSILGKKERWAGYKDKTHISLLKLDKWRDLANKEGFNVRLLPHIPLRPIKKIVAKYVPSIFFLPQYFSFTNDSITFFCIKNLSIKNETLT